MGDTSLPPKLAVVVNVHEITSTPSVEEVEAIARFMRLILDKFSGKLAIVNARIGHVTISQIVCLMASDSDRVRVCMNDNEALTWIKS